MSTAAVATSIRDRLHVVEHATHREIRCAHTVVMLHGIGGSAASCAPLADRLAAAGISAWCVDAPGYGASPDPSPTTDVVADVIDLIDSITPDAPVVLLGTSWGGVIAMSAALRRPDRIAALVIADSTRGSGTTSTKAAAMRDRIVELAERGADAVATARAHRLTAPTADPTVAASVRRSMADVRQPGFTAAAEFMAATDLGPELTRIDCPTLVLVGAHDTITGVDESRLLADTIPGAELHVLADAGHVAIQERPDAAADLVADFVRGLS